MPAIALLAVSSLLDVGSGDFGRKQERANAEAKSNKKGEGERDERTQNRCDLIHSGLPRTHGTTEERPLEPE
jgi:hypothetical protein